MLHAVDELTTFHRSWLIGASGCKETKSNLQPTRPPPLDTPEERSSGSTQKYTFQRQKPDVKVAAAAVAVDIQLEKHCAQLSLPSAGFLFPLTSSAGRVRAGLNSSPGSRVLIVFNLFTLIDRHASIVFPVGRCLDRLSPPDGSKRLDKNQSNGKKRQCY